MKPNATQPLVNQLRLVQRTQLHSAATRYVLQIVVAMLFTSQAHSEHAMTGDHIEPARIDGSGPGWRPLGRADFENVNCDPNSWTWANGLVKCSGTPVGVIRSKQEFNNFEFCISWRHLTPAGNSGVFIWTAPAALKGLQRDKLPSSGIEVQILDHDFKAKYEATGQKADWFTTHGDVFPVGTATMKPFAPTSPNGDRSFPHKRLSKGAGQWNHYYIRAINAEARLWVNGEEVSGGSECHPASGYLCLESEGAPVEFKNISLRELP
jgi:hypothetical protein